MMRKAFKVKKYPHLPKMCAEKLPEKVIAGFLYQPTICQGVFVFAFKKYFVS